MVNRNDRLTSEILHSKRIKTHAEEIWGWASPAGQARAERRARLLIQTVGMNSSHRVLEIGCGSGIFSEKFARTGAQVTAVDLSEDLLELARAKRIPGCEIKSGDAHNLTFPPNTFDIVCGSSVLHHLEIDRAVGEIFRVLKPGGKIVFSEPNMLNPIVMVMKKFTPLKKFFHESPDETAFFRWPLARKLLRAGFSEVEVIPYDFLYPSTPSWLVRLVEKPLRGIERIPLAKEFAGSLLIHGRKI